MEVKFAKVLTTYRATPHSVTASRREVTKNLIIANPSLVTVEQLVGHKSPRLFKEGQEVLL